MSNLPTPEPGAAGLPRPIKYLGLALLLPAIGFTTMHVLTPALAGAHDGGFMGMTLGIFLAQLAFAYVLLPRYRPPVALGVFVAASFLAWNAAGVLARNAATLGLPEYPSNGATAGQRTWEILFFALYCAVSVALWEIAYRLQVSRR
ncbi:MAG: hypothetical protein ABW277_05405 [Longimicrobiaceae bacterium]